MVISFLASFTQLLFKRGRQHDPCFLGDFLRVGLPLPPARSPKGLRRMPTLCGVSYGQMAKVDSLLKFACPPGPRTGYRDWLIGSIVLQVRCPAGGTTMMGTKERNFQLTPRRHLPRRSRSRGQLLPPSSGEARSLLREGTGGGSLRRLGPSERRPRSVLPFATGHVL